MPILCFSRGLVLPPDERQQIRHATNDGTGYGSGMAAMMHQEQLAFQTTGHRHMADLSRRLLESWTEMIDHARHLWHTERESGQYTST